MIVPFPKRCPLSLLMWVSAFSLLGTLCLRDLHSHHSLATLRQAPHLQEWRPSIRAPKSKVTLISSSLAFLFTYIPQGWWALPPGSLSSHLPAAPSPMPLTSGVPLHQGPTVHAQLNPTATTVTLEESRKGHQAGKTSAVHPWLQPKSKPMPLWLPGPHLPHLPDPPQ